MDRQKLINKYGDPYTNMNNKTATDMFKSAMKENRTANLPAEWMKVWAGKPEVPTEPLRIKMKRLYDKMGKLRRKEKENLGKEVFNFPEVQSQSDAASSQTATMYNILPSPSVSFPPASVQIALQSTQSKSPVKRLNLAQHEKFKHSKELERHRKKISDMKKQLQDLQQRKGHFSVKNVKKREARNVAILLKLRKEKNELRRKSVKQEKEISALKQENVRLKATLSTLEEKSKKDEQVLKDLKVKKRRAEKRASFHQMKRKEMERKLRDMEGLHMEEENDNDKVRYIQTLEGGRYNEKIRMCILELTALEVATGKMSDVIESVLRVCGAKCSNLPCRKACQNIIDEGQFIVQKMIGEKMRMSEGWGLHKDGTSRRKVKILDSTVQLDDGKAYCLGFSSVVSETAEAIAEQTQERMEELQGAVDEEGFKEEMIKKLKYFMNDRAGNEKKSSRLLEEWRDKVLQECGDDKASEVHHLFCTAHVLLGFHSYTIKALSEFNTKEQQRHPITTLLRDAADLFGPVGDYRGCRDVWMAFCQEKNIKSLIQNYKDNRFNALFEISAQTFHHHEDFIHILQTSKHNAKQTRLLKALQNQELMLILECLAIFFFKVTGPFWSFSVSQLAPSELPKFIQNLEKSLEKVKKDPHLIFGNTFDFFGSFGITSGEANLKLGKAVRDDLMGNLIQKIASALQTTLHAQMADLLSSGKYGDDAGRKSLSTASFSPLNNLVCERNFGVLDASQRRRPRASLHHHTSVIMLKQSRLQVKKFCANLSISQKKLLWAKATAMGRELRLKHRAHDQQVLMGSLEKALPAKKKVARARKRGRKPSKKQTPATAIPAEPPKVKKGDLVAVACEDSWYPAVILEESDTDIVRVDFGELGKSLGSFKWPNGRDIHQVSRKSILYSQLDVEPRAGGRLWTVLNAKEIQAKFIK